MATSVKADSLIIGVFGCCSVGNFHKIFIEDGYAGYFKQIDFAIIWKEAVNAFYSCFENYLQNSDQEVLHVEVKDEEENDNTPKNDNDKNSKNDVNDEPDIC